MDALSATLKFYSEFYSQLLRIEFRIAFKYGSQTGKLCTDMVKAGKQIFTFEGAANQSLIAMGAKLIKVEDLKKQY